MGDVTVDSSEGKSTHRVSGGVPPVDTAAIRRSAMSPQGGVVLDRQTVALCDALDAARAENADLTESLDHLRRVPYEVVGCEPL